MTNYRQQALQRKRRAPSRYRGIRALVLSRVLEFKAGRPLDDCWVFDSFGHPSTAPVEAAIRKLLP